jgi:uncharacterized membrane protein
MKRAEMSFPILVVTMVVLLVATNFAEGAPTFQGLGFLAGEPASAACAVSADGSNTGIQPFFERSFRWTAAGGMQPLAPPTPWPQTSYNTAYGVSADGSVIVGFAYDPSDPGFGGQGFRWTVDGGLRTLGHLPAAQYGGFSLAWAVSRDGSVIVGEASAIVEGGDARYAPFRWTAAEGMQPLAAPSRWVGRATAVSANGEVIVGGYEGQAFRWTSQSQLQLLGFLPGGSQSEAQVVSADGSTIIGAGDPAQGNLFRWTETDGMQSLGMLPGSGYRYGYAFATNADASTVVGRVDPTGAFIWREDLGIRGLRDVLIDEYGLDLSGWTSLSGSGISSDGMTIVGSGINPSGQYEAWIAVIPEPAMTSLLTVGAYGMIRRRQLRTCGAT